MFETIQALINNIKYNASDFESLINFKDTNKNCQMWQKGGYKFVVTQELINTSPIIKIYTDKNLHCYDPNILQRFRHLFLTHTHLTINKILKNRSFEENENLSKLAHYIVAFNATSSESIFIKDRYGNYVEIKNLKTANIQILKKIADQYVNMMDTHLQYYGKSPKILNEPFNLDDFTFKYFEEFDKTSLAYYLQGKITKEKFLELCSNVELFKNTIYNLKYANHEKASGIIAIAKFKKFGIDIAQVSSTNPLIYDILSSEDGITRNADTLILKQVIKNHKNFIFDKKNFN